MGIFEMLLNAIYLSNKNYIWHIKRQHNDFLRHKYYSTTFNTSMCKSCRSMVNLSEKYLPKPMLTRYIDINVSMQKR